jgi:hypothetical protein
MSETNWAALDAALCEKLGIAPLTTQCKCGHSHPKNLPLGWVCGSRIGDGRCLCPGYEEMKVYPALSTTGDGMLLLIEALGKAGNVVEITVPGVGYLTMVTAGQVQGSQYWREAPQAVAIAAARAYGIGAVIQTDDGIAWIEVPRMVPRMSSDEAIAIVLHGFSALTDRPEKCVVCSIEIKYPNSALNPAFHTPEGAMCRKCVVASEYYHGQVKL